MSNTKGTSAIVPPSGGGALSGMGEKFAPDLFTGTGNFSVPVAVPAGRNGFQPELTLGYSTGNGNGAFGMTGTEVRITVQQQHTHKITNMTELEIFKKLQHIGNNNFTRNFNYSKANNKLNSIDIGITNYAFSYDNCGNQLTETTSRHFEWDFGNRLRSFYVQAGSSKPTQHAQYLYDAGGTRVKKLVMFQICT